MCRYIAWYPTGHWSSTGVCFDIGGATAAIAVQLAGASYGASGIPLPWPERLVMRETLEGRADGLVALDTLPR